MKTIINKINSMLTIAFLSVILLQMQNVFCGPVILSGLDTEYGIRTGPGGTTGSTSHGTIIQWRDAIQTGILNNVTPPARSLGPILVIGGGKGLFATDDVTNFWTQIGALLVPPRTIIYCNNTSIPTCLFLSTYSMIAVVTDISITSTGLTQFEYDYLVPRAGDIAAFVNSGGGLFCSSSPTTMANPNGYAYVSLGAPIVSSSFGQDWNTPTALGITMNIPVVKGPFHDYFTSWPPFLQILSNSSGFYNDKAVILGGTNVIIPPPSTTNCCDGFTKSASVISLNPQSPGNYNGNWFLRVNLTAGPKRIRKVVAMIEDYRSSSNDAVCQKCLKDSRYFCNFFSLAPQIPLMGAGQLTDPTTTNPFLRHSREIIWGSNSATGTNMTAGANIQIRLRLPPKSPIGCCNDTFFFSIRFKFTDTTCVTCDTVIHIKLIQNGTNSHSMSWSYNDRNEDGYNKYASYFIRDDKYVAMLRRQYVSQYYDIY